MKLFIKRHPELSLRRPEKTNLSRATAFNSTTIKTFFRNRRFYNADETGLTTVTEITSIIAESKAKKVYQVTSACYYVDICFYFR